jgi:hypothetical protein
VRRGGGPRLDPGIPIILAEPKVRRETGNRAAVFFVRSSASRGGSFEGGEGGVCGKGRNPTLSRERAFRVPEFAIRADVPIESDAFGAERGDRSAALFWLCAAVAFGFCRPWTSGASGREPCHGAFADQVASAGGHTSPPPSPEGPERMRRTAKPLTALGGRSVIGGEAVEPCPVILLQADQLGHGVAPSLQAAAAVARSPVADLGASVCMSRPKSCLPFGRWSWPCFPRVSALPCQPPLFR